MAALRAHVGPGRGANVDRLAAYYRTLIASALPKAARGRGRLDVFPASLREGAAIVSHEAAVAVIHAGLRADIVPRIAVAIPGVERGAVLRHVGIDKGTLRRRVGARRPLDRAQTEGAVRVMELGVLAVQAFGTVEKAGVWLSRAHALLDGARPIDFSNNQYGFTKVRAILSAIRFGGVV